MAYTLISEKHDIWSCKLEDLTVQDAEGILKALRPGKTLKDLSAFMLNEKGSLVLNADHADYHTALKEGITFFEDTEERQAAYMKKHPCSIYVMAKQWREVLKEADVIKNKGIYHDTDFDFWMKGLVRERLETIGGKDSGWLMFRYGFIQGKRAERARRKRGARK